MNSTAARRLFALAAALLVVNIAAGADCFLRLSGVTGGSRDPAHIGWSDVDTAGFGVTTSAGSLAVFLPLQVLKPADAASPRLALACAQGEHFPEARLELVQATGRRLRFYSIGLSNVLVRGLETQRATNAGPVSETLSLDAAKVTWLYTEFDAASLPRTNYAACWDFARGQGKSSVTPVVTLALAPTANGLGRLSWPAIAGRTYRVLAAGNVAGPYGLLSTVVAPATGTFNLTVPVVPDSRFFELEENLP